MVGLGESGGDGVKVTVVVTLFVAPPPKSPKAPPLALVVTVSVTVVKTVKIDLIDGIRSAFALYDS